ncbi:MAG: hypothetical protein ACPGSB_05440, partial [Opitutales bacterium]
EYTVNLQQRLRDSPPPRPPVVVLSSPAELEIPPLGIDLDVGTSSVYSRGGGGFGAGLSGIREMALTDFLGLEVRGELAVVLDASGSMLDTISYVIAEMDKNFKSAMKVGVRGATFREEKAIGGKLIPIEESKQWKETLSNNNPAIRLFIERMRQIYNELVKREMGFAYETLISGGNSLSPSGRTQSLGKAIELLINDPRRPGTIYVFSDFEDGIDLSYMKRIEILVMRAGVKVVFWNPETEWVQNKEHYEAFAAATGGEVKSGGLN